MRSYATSATASRFGRAGAFLLALASFLLLASIPANAAPKGTVDIWGSNGEGNGQFSLPTGVAVNLASGDVYVGDWANGRVSVFDSSGQFLRAWGRDVVDSGPGDSVDEGFEICVAANGDVCQAGTSGTMGGALAGGNGGPTGIAIEQSTGSVWVGNPANNRVQKFDEDGNFILTFGDGVNQATGGDVCTAASGDVCQAGTAGSANGQFPETVGGQQGYAARLAVDQGTGRVYLADPGATSPEDGLDVDGSGNRRVQVFNSSGQFVSAFALPPGDLVREGDPYRYPATEPLDLAIDSSGVLFTTQQSDSNGGNQVRTFTTAGASVGDFAVASLPIFPVAASGSNDYRRRGSNPTFVGVDPANDHVYITQLDRTVPEGATAGDPSLRWEVAEYDPDGNRLEEHAQGIPNPSGVAIDPVRDRVYLTTGATSQVLVLGPVPDPPSATIAAATGLGTEGATLNGSVDPNGPGAVGKPTLYRFEYRKQGDAKWTAAPTIPASAGEGTVGVPVSTPVSGLLPSQTYEARLTAAREFGGGADTSPATTFTTEAVPPEASTRSAFPVVDTTATLRGSIDAKNAATSFYFEYGTDESYGSRIPVAKDADAGAGFGIEPVQLEVGGLQPQSTYHFRIVAENEAGTVQGEDLSFTTISNAEAAWPGRGVELVSLPQKGNQPVLNLVGEALKGPSLDDSITWRLGASGGPGSVAGEIGFYQSDRTPAGWKGQTLMPPPGEGYAGRESSYSLLDVTADGVRAVYEVRAGIFRPSYVVLWDRATQSQSALAQFAPVPTEDNIRPLKRVVVNGDASSVLAVTTQPLDGAHVQDTNAIYELAGSEPELISRLPNGAVPACGVDFELLHPSEWTSSDPAHDGSRAFFMSRGNSCGGATNLYRRDMETDTTTLVSGPPVAGTSKDSFFVRASADGDTAIFISYTRLDGDDDNADIDIYRWSAESGSNECLTCKVAEGEDVEITHDTTGKIPNVLASEDLSHLYFTSDEQLVPGQGEDLGANPDRANLYLLRDGAVRYIAPYQRPGGQGDSLQTQLSAPPTGTTRLAVGGKVLYFMDGLPLTPGAGKGYWYRYDDRDGSLECVICAPGGVFKALDNDAGVIGTGMAFDAAVDGDTAVFMSEVPLTPRDVNGAIDIYEWNDGRVRLITDGVTEWLPGEGRPTLWKMTPSGSDVFFTAAAKLTGHEEDTATQLFSAHRGGGFGPPPEPPAPCVEDACQGPLSPSPPLDRPGSSSFAGAGDPTVKPARKKRSKAKRTSASKRKRHRNTRGHRAKRRVHGAQRQQRNRGGLR